MVRNTYETELNGKKIGFKCGTLAIAIACREAKVKSTDELFKLMAEGDMVVALALFYGSASQYAISKKMPIDFTMDDVSDWLEELGEEESTKITTSMLESFIPKNLTAPQEGASQPQMNGSLVSG